MFRAEPRTRRRPAPATIPGTGVPLAELVLVARPRVHKSTTRSRRRRRVAPGPRAVGLVALVAVAVQELPEPLLHARPVHAEVVHAAPRSRRYPSPAGTLPVVDCADPNVIWGDKK